MTMEQRFVFPGAGQDGAGLADIPNMEKHQNGPTGVVSRDTFEGVIGNFIHKMNNATATILGKAQLAKMSVLKGKIQDPEGKLLPALESIEASVTKICEAMEVLQLLPDAKKEK